MRNPITKLSLVHRYSVILNKFKVFCGIFMHFICERFHEIIFGVCKSTRCNAQSREKKHR